MSLPSEIKTNVDKKISFWLIMLISGGLVAGSLGWSLFHKPVPAPTFQTVVPPAPEKIKAQNTESKTDADTETLDDWDEDIANEDLETVPVASASNTNEPFAALPETISGPSVTHRAPDFKKGKLQNIIVTDGLQLGNDSPRRLRQEPYQYSGVYFSPVFAAAESFDHLTADFKTQASQNAHWLFEFCTARKPGEWSPWEEARSSGQTVSLENSARLFQYRITLFADEVATSPKIQSVTITMKKEKGRTEAVQ